MENSTLRNIRLGVFVVAGTVFLITGLYLIGSKRNIFGDTFRIKAQFYTVNGLMSGNNVRFSGIDVGTVESISILNDSLVNVVMLLDEKVQPYIRKNAVASIGTDGLMGNKLVNINAVKGSAPAIEDGDILKTVRPIDTDEVARTLNVTNENLRVITDNLRTVTDRVESKNSLWTLLMDTALAVNIKASFVHVKSASHDAALLTGDLRDLVSDIKKGKGTVGAFIADTSLASGIRQIVVKLESVGDTAVSISGDLSLLVRDLQNGKGSMGVLLRDTTFVHYLNESIFRIHESAGTLNENLEALRYSWPFRRYFRKKSD